MAVVVVRLSWLPLPSNSPIDDQTFGKIEKMNEWIMGLMTAWIRCVMPSVFFYTHRSVPLQPPTVPVAPAAPTPTPPALLKWLLDAFVANVLAIEPRAPVRFHESSNGCSPPFSRPRSFVRRFFRDKSISDAVADTCVCVVRVAHGGDMLSRDVEKNPCCEMLWPNCGRFIIAFALTIPTNMTRKGRNAEWTFIRKTVLFSTKSLSSRMHVLKVFGNTIHTKANVDIVFEFYYYFYNCILVKEAPTMKMVMTDDDRTRIIIIIIIHAGLSRPFSGCS